MNQLERSVWAAMFSLAYREALGLRLKDDEKFLYASEAGDHIIRQMRKRSTLHSNPNLEQERIHDSDGEEFVRCEHCGRPVKTSQE